jgi:predicted acylesterase/phospholipase RssA/CRP-like cAMP-binding protein
MEQWSTAERAEFLGRAKVTAQLDESSREALAERLEPVALTSGEYLVRQGDIGDAMYFVVTGRLRVVLEGEDQRVIGRIGAGAIVGELALLADEPRLASVVAARDSVLLRLARSDFEEIIATSPQLLRAVAGTVVRRLGERGRAAPVPDRTIAVVSASTPEDPHTLDNFVSALRQALLRYGATKVVRPQDVAPLTDQVAVSRLLQEHEERNAFVILVGTGDSLSWTLRHADVILLVANGEDPPTLGAAQDHLGELRANPMTAPQVFLVLQHPREHTELRTTSGWLAASKADGVFHLRIQGGEVDRVARHIAGRAVGLALGGGGARGFAHLGVLRALEEARVPIDVIGGTSIGALVAAFYAIGWDADEREARAFEALAGNGSLFGVTLPVLSLSSAAKVHRLLTDERYLGERRIEDLWSTFCSISADLGRAESVVHDRGPLALAVRASISLPGILPPVAEEGRWLIDGGVLDNLPTDTITQRTNGGPLIAVDIRPQIDLSMTPAFGTSVSGWSLVGQRLSRRNEQAPMPSLLDVFMRASGLGSIRAQQESLLRSPADLLLRPPVGTHRILDFRHGPDLIRPAYEYTVAALENAPRSLWG